MIKRLLVCFTAIFVIFTSSCAVKAFEEEINVVFMYEDQILEYDTVTQFKNIKSPTLPKEYIYEGYKFFGWTALNPDTIKATDPNFDDTYIGAGKMVHWADVEEYKNNSTVVLRPLMIDKNEIPVEYHYVVIAWYSKTTTSGVTEDAMNTLKTKLFDYLRTQGVTEEDLKTIQIRGYDGNVGTSCGLIMEAEDVDIMLGWGSKDNVTSTGGMPEEMILETITPFKVGEKNRTLHRLNDKDTTKLVFAWLQSDECRAIFE